MPKVSFASTGARAGGKVNTGISKSAKENIKAQALSAPVMKVTTEFSTQQEPPAKPVNNSRRQPLQACTSSQSAKDADTATLLARIAQQQGLLFILDQHSLAYFFFSGDQPAEEKSSP